MTGNPKYKNLKALRADIVTMIKNVEGKLPTGITLKLNPIKDEESENLMEDAGFIEAIITISLSRFQRTVLLHAHKEKADSEVKFNISFFYGKEDEIEFYDPLQKHGQKLIYTSMEHAFSKKFIRKCASWVRSGALYAEYFLNLKK